MHKRSLPRRDSKLRSSRLLAQPPRGAGGTGRPEISAHGFPNNVCPHIRLHFIVFSIFLVPDWAQGPVQMCRDRRDVAGRALKVRFGCVFVEKVDFLFKFGCPSATYPFLGRLLLEDCFRIASTRFEARFSFRTRSSNLLSFSQSLPNHEFSKNG